MAIDTRLLVRGVPDFRFRAIVEYFGLVSSQILHLYGSMVMVGLWT